MSFFYPNSTSLIREFLQNGTFDPTPLERFGDASAGIATPSNAPRRFASWSSEPLSRGTDRIVEDLKACTSCRTRCGSLSLSPKTGR